MSWLQALIIGVLYYLSDAPWFFGEGYYVLQRPIVAGFLTGLVMGDPVTGTIIGATINLIYLGHLNVGGSMPTALAIATNVSTEVALAIAVPLGLLGTIWWVGKMTIDSFFVHWADSYAAKGDEKGVMLMNWLPSAVMMLVFKVIVAVVILMAGVPLMESFLNVVQGTNILHALEVVGGLLPALGIGLNLRAILKNETMPFLLVGFLLVAYFQISIVGVAMFGLVFALIYMQMNQKEDASYGG